MKIRQNDENDGNIINMSSLLDVMFILIIFFLATATFDQLEHDVEVSLPTAATSQSLSATPKVFVINVRSNGTYNVAERVMDLNQLKSALADVVATSPDQKVLVRGDHEALHGHVAAAVHSCKEAGIRQANIGYESSVTQ